MSTEITVADSGNDRQTISEAEFIEACKKADIRLHGVINEMLEEGFAPAIIATAMGSKMTQLLTAVTLDAGQGIEGVHLALDQLNETYRNYASDLIAPMKEAGLKGMEEADKITIH